MNYRPDIDGLRCIAVISVLLYHYGAAIPGGFVGVDVFFVISGYLITGQLTSVRLSTRALLAFYGRRFKRIVPALLLVIALCLIAGWFLLWPGDYDLLGSSAAWSAFGLGNFFFARHTGYFDPASDLQPLLHLWSLGVEEQFYFVWPLFLMLCGKRWWPLVVIAIVSFIWSVADSAFYMPWTRAWELAIGGLLNFAPRLSLPRWTGAIGLAGIAWGLFFLTSKSAFPGWNALPPVLGTALLIWQPVPALGTLRFVGKISYSLYLWHWPVFVFWRHYDNGAAPNAFTACGLGVVSIALAWLSWRYVEQPLRRIRWRSQTIASTALAACAVVCVAGYSISAADGVTSRIPQAAYDMRSLDAMWEWTCPRQQEIPGLGSLCQFGADWNTAKQRVLLWGDSHAEQMAPLFEKVAGDTAFVLYPPCSVVNVKSPCDYDAVVKASRVFDRVILTGYWTGHLAELPGDALRQTELAILRAIDDIVAPVTVLGDTPSYNYDPVPCALREVNTLLRRHCEYAPVWHADDFKARQGPVYQMLRKVASERPNIKLILPGDAMCDERACVSTIDGQFIYRDQSHIRRNLPAYLQLELARRIGLERAFTAF